MAALQDIVIILNASLNTFDNIFKNINVYYNNDASMNDLYKLSQILSLIQTLMITSNIEYVNPSLGIVFIVYVFIEFYRNTTHFLYYIDSHRPTDKLQTLLLIHTVQIYMVDKNMSYKEMIMYCHYDTRSSLSYKQIIKSVEAYTSQLKTTLSNKNINQDYITNTYNKSNKYHQLCILDMI